MNNLSPISPLNPFISENYPYLYMWMYNLMHSHSHEHSNIINNLTNNTPCCNQPLNVEQVFDNKFLKDCELSVDGKKMIQEIDKLFIKFNTCPDSLTRDDFDQLLQFIYKQTLYLYTLDCRYLRLDNVCDAIDKCEIKKRSNWKVIGNIYVCETTTEANWLPSIYPQPLQLEYVKSVNNVLPNFLGNIQLLIQNIPGLREELDNLKQSIGGVNSITTELGTKTGDVTLSLSDFGINGKGQDINNVIENAVINTDRKAVGISVLTKVEYFTLKDDGNLLPNVLYFITDWDY